MKPKSIRHKELLRLSVFSGAIRLISIPIGILTASLTSNVVSAALDSEINRVLQIGLYLILITAGAAVFHSVTDYIYRKSESKTLHKCKLDLYNRFLSSPLHKLYASLQGETIEMLNDDFDTVTGRWTSLYPGLCIGILTVLVYFAFIFRQSVLISLLLLAVSLIQIVPPIILKKFMQQNYDDCRDIEAKITDFTLETYHGFLTIKLYHLKEWWRAKLMGYHKEYIKIGNKSIYTSQIESAMDTFMESLLKYATYGIIGLLVLLGKSDYDIGIKAVVLSAGFYSAVRSVFSSITDFAVAKKAEERLSVWFEDTTNEKSVERNCDIKLNDVSFSYGDSDRGDILSHATASFPASKISLVKGANGIGKSTMLELISGMLRGKEGVITVGDIPAEMLSEDTFPRKIAYLPQEDASFDFSASEFYELALSEQEMKEAFSIAARFNLSDDLIRTSKIRELSGGERKKVFLSFIFALKARFILLDEPTNSLDEEGKRTLVELLKSRDGGAIIISHESLFDSIADSVYLFDKGKVTINEAE